MTTTLILPPDRVVKHGEAYLSGRYAKGCREANFDELGLIPAPASTATWHPVPYQTLVTLAKEILGNTLPGEYELVDEGYILAQQGNQMFGALTYKSARLNLPFACGLRGSYNKTLTESICLGGKVTVCSNLMFSGLVKVVRKNTRNVITRLQDLLYEAAREVTGHHEQLVQDISALHTARCSDDLAYQMLGLAWGREIISDRQLPVARQEWLEPSFDEFSSRTKWSLYNAMTYAMKSTHPSVVLEHLSALHRLFRE
ncbi:MAG: hypothetical protein KJ077_50435 [Anaerolineae bacterium]|nr:hypothetical protein [Anaerolineae bacterium]